MGKTEVKLRNFLTGIFCGISIGAAGMAAYHAAIRRIGIDEAVINAAIHLGWECHSSDVTVEGCQLIASTATRPSWKPSIVQEWK